MVKTWIKNQVKDRLFIWSTIIGIVISSLAVSTIIIMLLFDITNFAVSVAAISASVFMIFALSPKSERVSYRTILGAYAIVAVSGIIAIQKPWSALMAVSFIFAIIAMLMLKTMHTPAIGMLVSYIVYQHGMITIISVTLSVFTLIIVAKTLRHIISNTDQYKRTANIDFSFKKRQKKKVLVFDTY